MQPAAKETEAKKHPAFFLFQDGSSAAQFQEQNFTIHASPSGALFIVEKNLTLIRFLSLSLPLTFHEAAKKLFAFCLASKPANLFCPDSLLPDGLSETLAKKKDRFIAARWDQHSITAPTLEWQSLDRLVSIAILPHRQSFTVTFPTRVYSTDSDELFYVWVSQSHSCLSPPKAWLYPLLLMLKGDEQAQEVTQRLAEMVATLSVCQYSNPSGSDTSTLTNDSLEDQPLPDVVIGPSYITTLLPMALEEELVPSHASNVSFQASPLDSMSKCKAIRIIQNGLGCFESIVSEDASVEIEIRMVDGTLMRTSPDFAFLKIYPVGGWIEELYLIEGMAERWTNHYVGVDYPIKSILTLALALFQNVHASLSKRVVPTTTRKPEPFSTLVRHAVSIPDVGEFTLYVDGRCKCRFSDRTIVELPSQHGPDAQAAVLDSYGNSHKIRVANPVGYEWHVQTMLDYVQYISNGAAREPERLSQRDRIQEQIERSKQVQSQLSSLLSNTPSNRQS
ncbi:hypothetical protein HDU91_006468 [Kappamyces sp. JEL0680]|nr:hypothetical protein HDU91_006468 [Kappamyces sp. JEL0680]